MKTIKIYILSFFLSLSGQILPQAWSPDLPVNIKTFTEEEKAAQREKGNEFLMSLNKMVIKPNEDKEIMIEEDCRFSGSGSFSVSSLKRAKIKGAEGKNITFWFDTPHIYGMQLNKCANVTFENITFDCDPVPFTQGKITDKSGQNSVLLQPMTGYEELISNPNGTFIIFNPDGSFKMHTHRTCTIKQNADKSISLTNGNFDIAEIGDYIVLPSRTGSMISLTDCEKIKFQSVNVYASGGMCCVANTGKGGHEFDYFTATRRPGTNRLHAFGADGFHMNVLEAGPVITNSEMSYTADDLINLHGRFGWVCGRNSGSKKDLRIIANNGAISVGQEIDFWDNETQEYKGKAIVSRIQILGNQQEIDEARQGAIEYLGGNVYDIQLDREVEAGFASLIEHHTGLCSGFVVRNCKLHDTFNRGFLINGARDGIIEGNEIYNVASGQSFHMETWCYGEGQYIRNLTVRNNTFTNAGSLWFGTVPPNGNAMYGAYRTTPVRNIEITGNTIEMFPGDVFGINVAYTDGVRIEDNIIIRNTENKTVSVNNVNSVDGYGRSLTNAIFVSTCKNVVINNNRIDDMTPNNYNDVGYGTLVNNLEIDGEQQLNSIADVLSGWLVAGNQHDLNWSYGYVDAAKIRNSSYTTDDFILMTGKGSTGWLPEGLYSPSVGKQQSTPGSDRSSIIRWTSTVDGNLRVSGKIAPNGSSNGDKVNCYFFVDGQKKYTYDTQNGAVSLDMDLGPVKTGSHIDFILDSKGNTTGDQTFFNYRFLSDKNPPSAIQPVGANFRIHSANGRLVVMSDKPGELLSVYGIDGTCLLSRKISEPVQYISLEKGIYIVRLGEYAAKVIV